MRMKVAPVGAAFVRNAWNGTPVGVTGVTAPTVTFLNCKTLSVCVCVCVCVQVYIKSFWSYFRPLIWLFMIFIF